MCHVSYAHVGVCMCVCVRAHAKPTAVSWLTHVLSSAMGGAEDEDKACKVVSAVLRADQMLNKH